MTGTNEPQQSQVSKRHKYLHLQIMYKTSFK